MKRTERELDRCRHLLPHDLPADAVVHASLSPANAAVTEAHFERYLLGFGSSLFTILLLLVLVPRPISERLSTLRGDGLNLVEVYERIARNPRPIDIAFIGTSHTMTGIDDRGIEEALAKAGVRANVANLGTIWMGRDMHLFLTRELLASKAPKLIVLEINEHEPPYGHPLMPYIASTSDMFCCRFWVDLNFPKMFLLFLKEQFHGVISIIWPSPTPALNPPQAWDYGWLPADRILEPEEPKNPSLGDRLENLLGSGPRATAYKLVSSFGDQTVRQIVELAHSKQVKVIFLYLPEYIYAGNPEADNIRFYSDMSPVLFPPRSVVANRLNWYNFAHLNTTGALKLVPDLSAAIAASLARR
jgi:hypothetical protein